MTKPFWKWIKVPPENGTVLEYTKDFISDDNEYINEKNGWSKLESSKIEVEVEDGQEEGS